MQLWSNIPQGITSLPPTVSSRLLSKCIIAKIPLMWFINNNEVENTEIIIHFLTSKYLLQLLCIREQIIIIPINFLRILIFVIVKVEPKIRQIKCRCRWSLSKSFFILTGNKMQLESQDVDQSALHAPLSILFLPFHCLPSMFQKNVFYTILIKMKNSFSRWFIDTTSVIFHFLLWLKHC